MQHSIGRRASSRLEQSPRAVFRHLLWRGPAAFLHTWTIAMILMSPAEAASRGWSGTWRVTLALPGGPLPFGLEVRQGRAGVSAILVNPPERMRVEHASLDADRLTLDFPSYGSRLVLVRGRDDRLTGTALLSRSSGPVTLTAAGERGT